jgi:hypothetical protein
MQHFAIAFFVCVLIGLNGCASSPSPRPESFRSREMSGSGSSPQAPDPLRDQITQLAAQLNSSLDKTHAKRVLLVPLDPVLGTIAPSNAFARYFALSLSRSLRRSSRTVSVALEKDKKRTSALERFDPQTAQDLGRSQKMDAVIGGEFAVLGETVPLHLWVLSLTQASASITYTTEGTVPLSATVTRLLGRPAPEGGSSLTKHLGSFYKKWWFWAAVSVAAVGIWASVSNDDQPLASGKDGRFDPQTFSHE